MSANKPVWQLADHIKLTEVVQGDGEVVEKGKMTLSDVWKSSETVDRKGLTLHWHFFPFRKCLFDASGGFICISQGSHLHLSFHLKAATHIFKKIAIAGLWLLASLKLFSQGDNGMMFHHVNESNGLSYNIVNCIYPDAHGFLWIGTFNGLNRYDGAHFQVYKSNRKDPFSIASNVVHSVCEDHHGRIWCSTDDGISCFDRKNGQFTNFTSYNNEAFNFSFNLVCDRKGKIWFTGRKGLYMIDPSNFAISHFPASDAADSPTSDFYYKNGMVPDPAYNVLWCASAKGIIRLDCDTYSCTSYKNAGTDNSLYSANTISALCLSQNGKLFWADETQQEIFSIRLDDAGTPEETVLTTEEKQTLFDIATLFCDKNEHLWISSWNYESLGIDLSTGKRISLQHSDDNPLSIGAQFFWDVWQGNDGALWFGTVNGISITNPQTQFYTISDFENEARGETICSLGKLKDGTILLGLQDGSFIVESTDRKRTVITLPQAVENEYRPVVGFLETQAGIIVYTQQGMWLLDLAGYFVTPLIIEGITNEKDVHMAYIGAQGDSVLWIPCQRKGVLKYDVVTKELRLYSASSDMENFPDAFLVVSDEQGNVYATDRYPHLFMLRKGADQFEKIILDEAIIKELKTAVITDMDAVNGKVYLTHKGAGLLIYDPALNKMEHLDESDGMLYSAAMAAAFDKQSRLWIAAYNKISVFNPGYTFTNFSLPVQETAYRYLNTAAATPDGHILFGFEHELVEISPEKFDGDISIPSPLVSAIHCSDTTFILTGMEEEMNFAVHQNYFTIDFAQLFSHYDKVHYFYKLSGLNEEWVNAGGNTNAYFTNLSGGDYTFMVKAVLNNKESSVTSLKIHIETVFYKTWWFISFCFIVALIITVLVLRNRIRHRNLVHELAINNERLQREKASVQYDNLTNQLNPHFLFNSLSSLDGLIQDNQPLASSFLQHLSKVYRYVLQNKERETVSLQTELEFISNYVFLLETRFQEGFSVKYNILSADLERDIVPVTLQILVENAVKHNIITLSKPLLVEIESDGEFVIVKNNLRRKSNVETSNKQGMEKLKTLYKYITDKTILVEENETHFIVKIPLV